MIGLTKRAMSAAGVLAVALLSGSCDAEQTRSFGHCQAKAIEIYPGSVEGVGSEARRDADRGDYIDSCMGAEGYAVDFRLKLCGIYRPFNAQENCYAPTNVTTRWIFDLSHKRIE